MLLLHEVLLGGGGMPFSSLPSDIWVGSDVITDGDYAGRWVSGGVAGYVIYSDDRGATWKWSRPITQQINDITYDPISKRLYAATYSSANDVIYSTDGGVTWTTINIAPPAARAANYIARGIGVSPDGSKIIVGFQDTTGAFAYMATSTNGGATWTHQELSPIIMTGPVSTVNNINFITNSLVYASNNTGVYKSTNGGTTWTKIENITAGYSRMNTDSTGNIIVLASKAADSIAVTTNGGVTWNKVTNKGGRSAAMTPNGSVILVLDNVGYTIWRSTDYGVTWTSAYTSAAYGGTSNVAVTYDPLTGKFYASDGPRVVVSSDLGLTWSVP